MTRQVLATLLVLHLVLANIQRAGSASEPEQDVAVVEALSRLEGTDIHANPSLKSAVLRYLDRERGTTEYLKTIARFEIRERNDELLQLAMDQVASTQGVEAARLLLEFGDRQRLEQILTGENEEHATALATTLGLVGNRDAVNALKRVITNPARGRPSRTAAATGLGRGLAGQRFLLGLARDGDLTDDLMFAVTNALFGSRDKKIRQEAAKYLQRPTSEKSEPLPSIDELVNQRGDGKKGKEIFATIGKCATCHKVHGEGKEVGPDLSEIGSKLSRDALYVALLDPSAGISHNYETYTIVTVDGVVLSGIMISQTDEEVTIRTAEAVTRTIAREDVEQLVKQPTSLMPADLFKTISVQNLLDLVDYLVLLKKKDESGFHQLAGNGKTESAAIAPSREAGDATAGLDVYPGLEVSLFAAEPQMLSPTNIDIDHRGRVWVCEVVNYRHFRNPYNTQRVEGDRILVLEDSDGDGQADKATTFYQGRDIDSPHGICVLGNRVLVSAGSNVIILTDQDGDLQADQKELLFTGIDGVQHDHGIHAFITGPDGKLYFNFGNEGKQICSAGGQPIIDLAGNEVTSSRRPYQEGMVFRCNLDGSELETLGWNFRNNWEVCVDSFGTLWQSDNDDDGNRGVRINYVMQYGNYGYKDELTGAGWRVERTGMKEDVPSRHWHLNDPGVVPNLLQTGAGSPTGILIYEGDLLPKPLQNQIIHCDAGPNIVRAYPAEPNGAGYTASILKVLEGARDNWFRPSDVCVAPDGSLFVADWYDPGVGGHRMGDVNRGRLFRIAPKGQTSYHVPEFDFQSPDGAVSALMNPNLATRFLAISALRKFGAKAEPALSRVLDESSNPRQRARALWMLGRIENRGPHYVLRAAEDRDPNIRITAVRLAQQLGLDPVALGQRLVRDPSTQVRREVALSLRHNKSAGAVQLWVELAQQHDGHDRWYLEALGIAADRKWQACFAAWLQAVGDSWDTPAGRDIIWRSRAPAACDYLARIIAKSAAAGDLDLRYFRAFDFHDGSRKSKALKAILAAL